MSIKPKPQTYEPIVNLDRAFVEEQMRKIMEEEKPWLASIDLGMRATKSFLDHYPQTEYAHKLLENFEGNYSLRDLEKKNTHKGVRGFILEVLGRNPPPKAAIDEVFEQIEKQTQAELMGHDAVVPLVNAYESAWDYRGNDYGLATGISASLKPDVEKVYQKLLTEKIDEVEPLRALREYLDAHYNKKA
jgi:hypothetical protein